MPPSSFLPSAPGAGSGAPAPAGAERLRIVELAARVRAPGAELLLEQDGRPRRLAIRPGRWRGTLVLRLSRPLP